MIRKIIFFLFACITFLVLSAAAAVFVLKTWSNKPYGNESIEVVFKLERGMPLREVSSSLSDASLVSSSSFFVAWVKLFSQYENFKAGRYKFTLPVSPQVIAEKFIEGETFEEVVHQVSIPEGFTLNQVVERFVQNGIGVRSTFLKLSTDPNFLSELSIGARSIEGYLYPATYSFYTTPTEKEVFAQMVQTFWKRLPQGFEKRVAVYGITLHQAIILASLIEAETSVPEEKPMVSEVLMNRLNIGMSLGIDAAVIYGIPNFDGNLRSHHLKDNKNPYNLRVKKGLPPTPITSPTATSLQAVVNPTHEGYLYYVLDPKTGNTHTFTKSHKEHSRAVKKLVASKRQ